MAVTLMWQKAAANGCDECLQRRAGEWLWRMAVMNNCDEWLPKRRRIAMTNALQRENPNESTANSVVCVLRAKNPSRLADVAADRCFCRTAIRHSHRKQAARMVKCSFQTSHSPQPFAAIGIVASLYETAAHWWVTPNLSLVTSLK